MHGVRGGPLLASQGVGGGPQAIEQSPEPPPLIARPDAEGVDETSVGEPPTSFLIEFGDTNDWIQFKAGEWLKGELKRLHQKDVEFKSKKLKLMTFKWKDIVQLQARKIKTYVFEAKSRPRKRVQLGQRVFDLV
jgi:hypothetical protein